jgi:mannose-1-phosphate guanylyltransferase
MDISYVHEKQPTGTGGALRATQKLIDSSPFIVMYSDVLLDLDINEFSHTHTQNKSAVGTLALTSVADPSTYGAVKLRGSRIMEFSEKPPISNEVSRLVFAGCAVFNRSVFNHLPPRRSSLSLEQDVFPKLIKKGRLAAFPFEGRWFDVSTPKIYEQVLQNWSSQN